MDGTGRPRVTVVRVLLLVLLVVVLLLIRVFVISWFVTP